MRLKDEIIMNYLKEFVAVERVGKYCSLDSEVNPEGSINPPFGWPCQGVISFKDVYLKYRYIHKSTTKE